MNIMKRIIVPVFLLLCLAVASFSAWKLFGYYRTYHDGKEEYDQLTDYVEKDDSKEKKKSDQDTEEQKDKGKDACPVKVDFDSLKKINPDIVGWLHIPDTPIDYPIVQAKNNSKYLHRTFRGKDSYVGAIFLDALCAPDFSSFNSIIYGHNLKNGEMFGHLKKLYDIEYNSKADYRKHPKIWVITPEKELEYEIFAFREVSLDKDMDAYTVDLSDETDCALFFDRQIERSQKDTGIIPSGDKKMLTLSTCVTGKRERRFILQAVSVE